MRDDDPDNDVAYYDRLLRAQAADPASRLRNGRETRSLRGPPVILHRNFWSNRGSPYTRECVRRSYRTALVSGARTPSACACGRATARSICAGRTGTTGYNPYLP